MKGFDLDTCACLKVMYLVLTCRWLALPETTAQYTHQGDHFLLQIPYVTRTQLDLYPLTLDPHPFDVNLYTTHLETPITMELRIERSKVNKFTVNATDLRMQSGSTWSLTLKSRGGQKFVLFVHALSPARDTVLSQMLAVPVEAFGLLYIVRPPNHHASIVVVATEDDTNIISRVQRIRGFDNAYDPERLNFMLRREEAYTLTLNCRPTSLDNHVIRV
ncbi:uncharacterized protein LOC131932109 [Physella acuta]|uniref:uncharacterized protein LOC131932109 n=1 Tax=Physella acuta TaxID=109671 RepID=UPI0027DE0CD5|nr:uncharacterized protein LOC131932109 [Physella acuta]